MKQPLWTLSLPDGWQTLPLRHVAQVRNSNVDKRTYEDGIPVRLCNYTDVYYNEYITPALELMKATATASEAARFGLLAGDVIITKDSESWDDIAIPACVPEDMPGVVCGYHLTMLRPCPAIHGRFLLRALQAEGVREQFWLAANGVTRFGIGQQGMKDALIPTPPLPTQRAIADFLDRKTAAIDALIEKKERLLALLAEKRAALIHRAVTKGLDPSVPMKDSGVPWIGEIPAHWTLTRVKFECDNLNYKRIPLSVDERSGKKGPYPYYGASGVIDHVDDYLFDETTVLIAEDGANLVLRSLPLAIIAEGQYWVNNHAHILRPRDRAFCFWAPLLKSLDYRPFISGSAQPKLTAEAIGNVVVGVPPAHAERRSIARHISGVEAELAPLMKAASRHVELLREYRQALITAAVTGQLDIAATHDATPALLAADSAAPSYQDTP